MPMRRGCSSSSARKFQAASAPTATSSALSFNCPGHYSRFDPEKGGQQIWGHATQNLPQYVLRVDDKGDIYAEGVDELLYGRLSNVL
jgi:arsenite oxidase small subunit